AARRTSSELDPLSPRTRIPPPSAHKAVRPIRPGSEGILGVADVEVHVVQLHIGLHVAVRILLEQRRPLPLAAWKSVLLHAHRQPRFLVNPQPRLVELEL